MTSDRCSKTKCASSNSMCIMFGLRFQNQCFPLLPKNIIFGTQVIILFFQITVFHLLSSVASDDNRQKGCTSPKMASKQLTGLIALPFCFVPSLYM